jgi:hypothetical protein
VLRPTGHWLLEMSGGDMQQAQRPSIILCFLILQCPETSLRKTLQNTIGAIRMIFIWVTDLIVEIEKVAVLPPNYH